MKYLSRLCALVILTLSLTLSAYAGHIPCGVTDDPPPPTQEAVTGEMQNGVESTDPVTEIVILLLGDILPII
ncbi:MAG TPA: hypothetical protein VGN95_23115 [Pyrinomonadaceae bacterium]|jgi:hypothetical protein|nr:hypothetical protein [Pyrinomonadaceae bacterium]